MGNLPDGQLTFLLTDIIGSTNMLRQEPSEMESALQLHTSLATSEVGRHEGILVRSQGEGDSLFAVFKQPARALTCAVAIQKLFESIVWPTKQPIKVRIGIHAGEAIVVERDYLGLDVNLAARIRSLAPGPFILTSAQTLSLLSESELAQFSTVEIGLFHLRDFPLPLRLFQIRTHPHEPRPVVVRAINLPKGFPQIEEDFIGRGAELAAIEKAIKEGHDVSITGPPGIGKSRLAAESALQHAHLFANQITYLESPPSERIPYRKQIVIVDNVEAPGASLKEFLQGDSPVIYVTSGGPLPDTVEVRLSGLRFPSTRTTDPNSWNRSEANRYLQEVVKRADPNFDLAQLSSAKVRQALQTLKGNPARLRLYGLSLLTRGSAINDSVALAEPSSDHLEKLSISYELLSDQHKRALTGFAVLPGGFIVDLVEDDSIRASVNELVKLSLIERVSDERYEVVANPFLSGLSDSADFSYAFSYVEGLAKRLEAAFQEGEVVEGIRLGDQEWPNLAWLLNSYVGSGDAERLVELTHKIRRYWSSRNDIENGLHFLAQALSSTTRFDKIIGGLLSIQAFLQWRQGMYHLAKETYLLAKQAYEVDGSESDAIGIEHNLGIIASEQGDKAGARVHFQRCLEVVTRTGPLSSVQHCLLNLSRIANDLGEFHEAERLSLEATAVIPQGKTTIIMLGNTFNLVDSLYHQGRYPEAAVTARRATLYAIELEDWDYFHALLPFAIGLLVQGGNYGEAERLIGFYHAMRSDLKSNLSDRHRNLQTMAGIKVKATLPDSERLAYHHYGATLSPIEAALRAIEALDALIKEADA